MKKLIFLLLLQLVGLQGFAHEGGHGAPTKVWELANGNTTITADFIKKVGEIVYLTNENHEILVYDITDFKAEEQHYILDKSKWINQKNSVQEKQSFFRLNTTALFIFLGILVLLFSAYRFKKKAKGFFWAYSLLALLLITIGCKTKTATNSFKMAANNVSFLESIFGVFDKVNTRHDAEYFYIESDGIPEHEMMTGITSWQQQVPINHDYTGANAWAIPLQPELAENPLSTKDNFMKGAIAIAANGIPIFNPLNNRGEDANVIGELDKWGGHCGRADDYHYHLPPIHLQSKVGATQPIAYALDGFPVYGETKQQLDENLGRFTSDSTYQYHAVQEYPYLIAAMKGKVTLNPRTQAPENEIMPQAKTKGVRPDLRPLRGAEIIGFKNTAPNKYRLTYKIDTLTHIINYGWDANGYYDYEFVNPDGTSTKSRYERK
ncbi:YHYH protein [Cellulophaga sp. L1A9]|uniref:YHYH protein n=1 Tax=Cellulophaga sp. L1A9 TaxID=2686362 RepID=UPI00131E7C97|nr:YHYH protein [Cellulophaga sp. L1A9]